MFAPSEPPIFATLPQLPPNDLKLEAEFIGSILLDESSIGRVKDILPEEAIYLRNHRIIYRAALALEKQQLPVSLLSITHWLADRDLLKEVGGHHTLAVLVDCVVSSVNIDFMAEALLEKHLRRKVLTVGSEIEQLVYQPDKPLSWILEKLEDKVLQLTGLRKKPGKEFWKNWDEVAFERLCKDLEDVEAIENAAQRSWAMRKLAKKWKFSSQKELLDFHAKWLDSQSTAKTYTAREYFEKHGNSEQSWLIPGFVPAQSIIAVYADGGVGKTRLGFTIAKHAVTGQAFGYENMSFEPMNVLFIETDQGARVTSKLLEMQDFLADKEVGDRLTICDEWTIGEFGRLKTMLRQHKPKLVIIDSLTSISVDSIYSEKDAEYARPLVRLRHIAHEYDCTFLVIHHSNANGDMRGSRAVRNTVDEVLKFSKNQNEAGVFNVLTIEKTRSRAPGAYKFTYDEETWGWQFKGRIEDDVIGSNAASTNNMTRCLEFLRQNMGVPYESGEVAEALGVNRESVRRDLKRAAAEGLCNSGRSNRDNRALVYYCGTRVRNNTSPTSGSDCRRCVELTNVDENDSSGRCDQPDQSDQSIRSLSFEKNVEMADHIDHISEENASSEDTTTPPDLISELIRSTDQVDHIATFLNNSEENREEAEKSCIDEESNNENNDFETRQKVLWKGKECEVISVGFESLKIKLPNGDIRGVKKAAVILAPPPLPEPELFILGKGAARNRKVDLQTLVGKRVRLISMGGEECDVLAIGVAADKPIIIQSVKGKWKGWASLKDLE